MLKYVFFYVTFNTLGRLPLHALYGLMNFVGAAAYYFLPKVRRNVHANLRHVMPEGATEKEIERAARRIFQNVALYYADLAHMPHMDINQFFNDRMVIRGVEEHLRPAIAEGKGVVMLGAHFGNPELAGQGLIPLGIPVFALTEPLDPRISRLLDRNRSSKGHTFAPVSVGNVKRVMQTLKKGGVVALMGDRDIQGPRALLTFCGVQTLMPTGPIEVALRTGATVVPSFSMRRNRYVIDAVVEEPLELEHTGDLKHDARVSMLRFLERYERRLRAEPEQWGVLEAIWDGGEGRAKRKEERGKRGRMTGDK
jgi:KDO2-lipid IV(A) lauroyltransferase